MTRLDFGDVGRRVSTYRRLAGLSRDRLVEAAGNGITHAALVNIELGRRDLSVIQLGAIAVALGIPLSAILFDIEKPLEPSTIDLSTSEGEPNPLPVWQAIAWLSGELDDEQVVGRADVEWNDATNRTYPLIWGFQTFRRLDAIAARTRRELADLRARADIGRLDERETSWMHYLEGRLPGEEESAAAQRDRVIAMGVDLTGWKSDA